MGKLKNYQTIKQVNSLRKTMKSKQKQLDQQLFSDTQKDSNYQVTVSILGNRKAQHVSVKDIEGNAVNVVNEGILQLMTTATNNVLEQISTNRNQLFRNATKELIDENDKTKTVNKKLQKEQAKLDQKSFEGLGQLSASNNDERPTVIFNFKGDYRCESVDAHHITDLSEGKLSRLFAKAINNGIGNINLETDVLYDKYS